MGRPIHQRYLTKGYKSSPDRAVGVHQSNNIGKYFSETGDGWVDSQRALLMLQTNRNITYNTNSKS